MTITFLKFHPNLPRGYWVNKFTASFFSKISTDNIHLIITDAEQNTNKIYNNIDLTLGKKRLYSVWKIRKNIYRSYIQVTFELYKVSYVYRSFIPNRTTFTMYCLTKWISKLPGSFQIHRVKAVPGKFHGCGRHSKHNCLQERAHFHRFQAWQIVQIFNTIYHFNPSPPGAAHKRQWIGSALVQIMACRLFAKPLSKPMLGYCQLDP